MKPLKISYLKLAIALTFTLIIIACSTNPNQNSQLLQEQVFQLQTQNALLQESALQQTSSNTQVPIVPDVPEENTSQNLQVITATSESLPNGPVPAGIPIIFDNWSIFVKNEIRTFQDTFEVNITVRNLSTADRSFRYIVNDVTVTDDQGKTYDLYANVDSNCEANNGVATNIMITAGDSKELYGGNKWGDCGESFGLRDYQGPIGVDVKQMHVHLNNFGPLNNVEVVIDL